MATISVSASAVQAETGSAIGKGYRVTTQGGELTNRETNLVTQAESSFLFTPVTTPSILVVNVLSLANPGTGDATTSVHWGYSTLVYQHELYIGESAVVRLRNGGPVTQLYMASADTTSPSHFFVECQIWEF